MTSALLLDTCAAIWLANGDPMSMDSRKAVTAAQAAGSGTHISPITAWELATLVTKGRLTLSWRPGLGSRPCLHNPEAVSRPCRQTFSSPPRPGTPPKDPADRIVAAIGRAYGHAVVTRDGELLPYGAAGHIETIRC